MGKTTLAVGFAAGYVAGAAAGRQRYEQIRQTAQSVLSNPKVQQATSKVQTSSSQLLDKGKSKVNERVESRKSDSDSYDVVEIPGTRSTGGTSAGTGGGLGTGTGTTAAGTTGRTGTIGTTGTTGTGTTGTVGSGSGTTGRSSGTGTSGSGSDSPLGGGRDRPTPSGL